MAIRIGNIYIGSSILKTFWNVRNTCEFKKLLNVIEMFWKHPT